MGYYINPEDGRTKEQWLEDEGKHILSSEVLGILKGKDELPVCLVNNGHFTAAGIAYDAQEAEAFLRFDDRPKNWFKVSRSKLLQFFPPKVRADYE